MRILLLVMIAVATQAWGQPTALSPEALSEAQRAEYGKLVRGYRDAFKVLGRSRVCGLNFDAEPHFREVARRHGEASEPMTIARLSYAAAADNQLLSRDIDPTPPAPIPCDVLVYLRELRLPELPASLVRQD